MDLRVLDLIKKLKEQTGACWNDSDGVHAYPLDSKKSKGVEEMWEQLIALVTTSNRKELLDAFMKEEPTELKYDPSKPEGYWKVVVAYYMSDFEGFDLEKLDEQIYDALSHRSVDGGQGTGFGSRDFDAFFDVKRFAEKSVEEVGRIEGAENLTCYMIQVNPCCGVADECICDD